MQRSSSAQQTHGMANVGIHAATDSSQVSQYIAASYGMTMAQMSNLMLPYGALTGHGMLNPELTGYGGLHMLPVMGGDAVSLSQFEREAAALAESMDSLQLNPRAKEFVPPNLKAWPMFPTLNALPAHYLPRDMNGMPIPMPMLPPLAGLPGMLPMPGQMHGRNASHGSRVGSDKGDRGNGNGNGRGGGRQKNNKKKPVQHGLEENVMRTIYICDIDQQVTEEQLANVFQDCGAVIDCRVCGDPNSAMRFAFIEFTTKESAAKAISKTGTVLGAYPLRVLPSKTAIVPVNNEYLPRTVEEREQCSRTVYAANICRKVDKSDVQRFFATLCGPVSRIRLLGDSHHNTRIAFVEFQQAESAKAALNCSGALLGSLPIRVSPSKTPVRADPRDNEQ